MRALIDPVRYSPALDPREDGLPRHSDGYRLIELVHRYWRLEDGKLLTLDGWQQRLLIRVLETDAAGALRFRQVLISIGRQNGKSVLGGVLALYGLLQMVEGATVIGIASSREQADIIFKRVAHAVRSEKALAKRFRVTNTRGMGSTVNAARYDLKPAKPGAIQGIPVNLGLVDELHLEKSGACWDDIVNGQRAQTVALVIGITTAGDNESKTLKRLYEQAPKAIADPSSRFGVFIYEGIEGAPVDDAESILRANPAVACGRVSLETVLSDVQSQPEHMVRRYLHNLFIDSENPFIDPTDWIKATGTGIAERDRVVFGVDVSKGWKYATISAARKGPSDSVEVELVQSFNSPTLEGLEAACVALKGKNAKSSFAMDPMRLADLSRSLRTKGYDVMDMSRGGYLRSTEHFYSAVKTGRLKHNDDALLNMQIRYAKSKALAGGNKIVGDEIDAVTATAYAVYAALTKMDRSSFVH